MPPRPLYNIEKNLYIIKVVFVSFLYPHNFVSFACMGLKLCRHALGPIGVSWIEDALETLCSPTKALGKHIAKEDLEYVS